MIYQQKKGKNQIHITLEDSGIKYSVKDDSVSAVKRIDYESISSDRFEFVEKNNAFKQYSYYLLVLGLITLGIFLIFKVRVTSYTLFFTGSLITFILYKLSIVKYTVLESSVRNIYIIQDDKHDEIVETIYSKRNKYLKDKYGMVNFTKDPSQEIEKFKFLLTQGVINQEEFKKVQSEITFHTAKPSNKRVN